MNKRFQEIPEPIRAVLGALRFSAPDTDPLARLNERDWNRVLPFCDASHLTLPLFLRCGERLPQFVWERTRRNLQDNSERWERLKAVWQQLSAALDERQLRYVVLKGFSQWPLFVADPRHRAQYDIDLLVRQEDICEAAEAAAQLGYEHVHANQHQPSDHLPTMIRRTGWRWKGDYYDPDIPFSLELHFRCWNSESEHFGSSGIESAFWARAIRRHGYGLSFPCLYPADAIHYASMHALRHLLHGNLRPSHVYEMAHCLHFQAENDSLWQEWSGMKDEASKLQLAICFGLAQRWFGCRVHQVPASLIQALPIDIKHWLELCAYSPLASTFKPNKDEVWLHWTLIKSKRKRFALLRRKLTPWRLPGAVDAVHIKPGDLTWRVRLVSRARYVVFVVKRVSHHLRAFIPTVGFAIRWFGKSLVSRSAG